MKVFVPMPQKSKMTTAVLVFANSPSTEMFRKPIPNAENLYHELTEQVIQTVEKSGLSYFHFTEHEQIGSSFGERFTNAIQAVFDHGFDNVITIGNDSPQLKASHIRSASLHLDRREFVLGPSTDGGFYLMGIQRTQFNATKFKNLPWQTNRTAAALLGLIQETNPKVVRLETLTDVDCISDLKQLLKLPLSIPNAIMEQMRSILGVDSLQIIYEQIYFSKDFGKSFYNKGSPLVALI